MLDPEVTELLRRPDVLVYLATTDEDGAPHLAPLWADVDPERGLILLNTAEGRRKVRNLRRDPRVMLAAHAPEQLWPPLSIRGTVIAFVHEGADAHIDALARRYTGEPWETVPDQQRVILEIRPDHVAFPRD